MAPALPRLRILSVGGNAVSAFLSWRLQATNACDVTLVWKNGYQAVAQYGISFKSLRFGNERFKPRHVVQSTDEAATREAAFDYVLLCVKALPDVYDLAAIIESVVTPQHTCVIVNTTNTLGVEQHLEERFPSNVVLSLVSGADLMQLGASEFEHAGNTDIWVGPANMNSAVDGSISNDMSEALAMTLATGQVNCTVSSNIRQQQYERMIGPIAFQPASVIFETASIPDLLEKVGVPDLVSGVIDELLQIASSHNCEFASDFKEKTMQNMLTLTPEANTMFQDFLARRPMEIETYLRTPLKFAEKAGILVPRLQTLYAILHQLNKNNQSRPPLLSPAAAQPPPRVTSAPPPPRPPMNGQGRGGRMSSVMGVQVPPSSRRGPPPVNGYRGPPNGYPPRQVSRKPSFEENLDEFSHVVLYDDIPEGDVAAPYEDMPNGGMPNGGMPNGGMPNGGMPNGGAGPSALDLREREIMLRQRELRLREQEMAMKRGGRNRRASHARRRDFDDDDDDDDYFDPMEGRGPPLPQIDPDNFDMMSVTSRRTRKAPSQAQLRKTVFEGGSGMRPGGGGFSRPHGGRNSGSTRYENVSRLTDNVLDNPMMSYSSNRYGAVDRKELHEESRANSLTAGRMQELGHGGGPYPGPPSRRTSQSPGNPFGPMGRGMGRHPSPPDESHHLPNGMPNGLPNGTGRPSPPGGMRAPVARHALGHGNEVHPQQVEQQVGRGEWG
ncbi:hypothetical protein GJ744_008779 [Endocarpon pusillum]|uniref:2-dehydropantoate 2-reductase n=1 Tax=Endocarpon pusillum TaxID=364733 RepID=A0A8H7AYJ8_9EURO|nr:hypothetical protein GJ744_008779 [Endocarpon pusillum]